MFPAKDTAVFQHKKTLAELHHKIPISWEAGFLLNETVLPWESGSSHQAERQENFQQQENVREKKFLGGVTGLG